MPLATVTTQIPVEPRGILNPMKELISEFYDIKSCCTDEIVREQLDRAITALKSIQTATALVTTKIPVEPRGGGPDSRWLVIDIPNGWDDVKKISRKVLSFEGRTYVFSSWNSDTYLCHFKESTNVATIKGSRK